MIISDEMPEVGGNKTADKSGSSKSLVEARDTFQTLFEMSRLLNTGLDMETLAICVRLCEQVRLPAASPPVLTLLLQGANPEALAIIIRELRRESEAIRQNE